MCFSYKQLCLGKGSLNGGCVVLEFRNTLREARNSLKCNHYWQCNNTEKR